MAAKFRLMLALRAFEEEGTLKMLNMLRPETSVYAVSSK
jgi:hypothetical protein